MADPREPILALFERYGNRFPQEVGTVERISQFVRDNPDCFERELKIGHITGSAWLLDPGGERVLLTHHRKLDMWVQLGGHVDGEADVAAGAMREAIEESGISDIELVSPDIFDIDIHAIPARGDEPEHFHYDCRFLMQAASDDYRVSEESHDLAWIPLDKITDYTTEASILRMVEKLGTVTDFPGIR